MVDPRCQECLKWCVQECSGKPISCKYTPPVDGKDEKIASLESEVERLKEALRVHREELFDATEGQRRQKARAEAAEAKLDKHSQITQAITSAQEEGLYEASEHLTSQVNFETETEQLKQQNGLLKAQKGQWMQQSKNLMTRAEYAEAKVEDLERIQAGDIKNIEQLVNDYKKLEAKAERYAEAIRNIPQAGNGFARFCKFCGAQIYQEGKQMPHEEECVRAEVDKNDS